MLMVYLRMLFGRYLNSNDQSLISVPTFSAERNRAQNNNNNPVK